MAKIRVFIVDDHSLFRESLRTLLEERDSSIEVVGSAESGIEAIAKSAQLRPDVILMDIAMPGINGLEATRRIKRENPSVKVLALTMHGAEQYIIEMLRAGASGYVLKSVSAQDLISAVEAVYRSDVFLYPPVVEGILNGYLERLKAEGKEGRLTARELEILLLIAEGKANKEIATLLEISVSTIQSHRLHLMEKLGIHDRTGLVRYAIREGLMQP